jgi:hypothetical protein
MNAEIITELRTIYREHLFTEEGKKQMRDAIEMKKMWRAQCEMTDCRVDTAGVKPKLIPRFLRDRMTCIEITPIGLNNMCHITSDLFAKKHTEVKKVLGYNITACPCGRLMSMEIHSVNKIGDTFYDFTRDFNDEKTKYFIAMDTELTSLQHNRLFGREPITINKNCRCPIRWDNAKQYIKTDDEIEAQINEIENISVIDTGYGYMIGRRERK